MKSFKVFLLSAVLGVWTTPSFAEPVEKEASEAGKMFDKAAQKGAMDAIAASVKDGDKAPSVPRVLEAKPVEDHKAPPPPPPDSGDSSHLFDALVPLAGFAAYSALGGFLGLFVGLFGGQPHTALISGGVLAGSIGVLAGVRPLINMIENRAPVGGIRGAIGTLLKRVALVGMLPLTVLPSVLLAAFFGALATAGAFLGSLIPGALLGLIHPTLGAAFIVLATGGVGLAATGGLLWTFSKSALVGENGNGGLLKAIRENW